MQKPAGPGGGLTLHSHEIRDLDVYLHRMQKSVLDKLFFMDKVFEPFDTVLDFGCANGEVVKALHALFGGYRYVGYDISEEMIAAARKNVPEAFFTTVWEETGVTPETALLNISSTVHEIYSYCPPAEIDLFWRRVFQSGFRYVTIRDMMLSEAGNAPAPAAELARVRANGNYRAHLRDYESVWGEIRTVNDLTHYLLKYSYTQNWDREVRENYVPLPLERFLALIPPTYEITYLEHFTLPYIAWQVKNDFGASLKTPTHIKIILRKKQAVQGMPGER